jgi:predicted nucleic acid-binding protein
LILLDASGLFAALSGQEPANESCRMAIESDPGPLVLSPFVLAEVDHLVSKSGVRSELGLLSDVAEERYALAQFDAEAVGECLRVIERYQDLRIGLADASLVVLAGRHKTNRVLTLDERHFRALRTPAGKPFTNLPADA